MDQVGGPPTDRPEQRSEQHAAPSAYPAPEHHPASPATTVWHRIAGSLVEMAIITGVLVRVLHVVASAHGTDLDWHSFVGSFILVPVILLALATVHLAQYPLPQWLWRAPLFALVESTVEALGSLALIYIGRERWGTGRAEFGDWPSMAGGIYLSRFLMVCLFALVLGLVAQFVRRRELAHERKRHAAYAGVDRRKSTSYDVKM